MNDIEQKACELKYSGIKYKKMSELLDVNYDTLVSWFRKDGKIYQDYQEYAIETNRQAKLRAINLLTNNVERAIEVLVNEMHNSDSSQAKIKAACEILNRVIKNNETQENEETMTWEDYVTLREKEMGNNGK